jgi:hypothetical protein
MTDIERDASEARYLLGNPLLKAAFDGLREATVQSLEDNPMQDEVMRDKLMLTLQVIKEVRAQIYAHIETELVQVRK